MTLSKERIGEIAMYALQHKLENDGNLKLMPTQIKREVKNSAKKSGFPINEVAEFFKILLEEGYKKTISELDEMIADKVED